MSLSFIFCFMERRGDHMNYAGSCNHKRGRPRKEDAVRARLETSEKKRFPLPSAKELRAMSRMEVADMDKDKLVDLESVEIDPDLDVYEWQREFIRQTGNPFFVRICGYPVRMPI